ncbi:phenylacetaldoxime dehydratase family protein [Haliea sp. E1-2-M8]|uniref:phenylacetaldoxime dehydratase family protein n=1 Tax=Haliea sp. E1-2-M8 TaxID=3064706 RepID=UPI0027250076|nr:phenylacetaldoxime dehydratase family protein [Haliea sp. E1-2-M8]MDO8863351.1 phenylacetaldoxime dehydratase family protein [Haliea sp. E1-2-M8]
MPRNNTPPDWQPPAPAWQSVWQEPADPLISAYFGLQGDDPAKLDAWARDALQGALGPLSLERGSFRDQAGATNFLYIAYWRESVYQQWWREHEAWWDSAQRLEDGVGYWREIILSPLERLETLHSTPTPHGAGVCAAGVEGPILEHGYAGGARDRIPLSASHCLRETANIDQLLPTTVTSDPRRVRVTAPENMCVIRSGQNWSHCNPAEKAYYLEQVHPVLLEGMRFLRDNPAASSCFSMRFVGQHDTQWQPLEESFGLGYATDIHAFENWARDHPTHVAIFDSFMQMVATFGETMQLRLWHEVSVLPREGSEFEYIGCHPQTGLLRHCRYPLPTGAAGQE